MPRGMITTRIDKVHVHFDNIIVIGYLNYDLVKPDKFQFLLTVCDIFDFTKVIKTPTCFIRVLFQSIRHYFSERCAGGPKSKHFWSTVKPFLSNKGLLKTL